jgi:hypothetical protein
LENEYGEYEFLHKLRRKEGRILRWTNLICSQLAYGRSNWYHQLFVIVQQRPLYGIALHQACNVLLTFCLSWQPYGSLVPFALQCWTKSIHRLLKYNQ